MAIDAGEDVLTDDHVVIGTYPILIVSGPGFCRCVSVLNGMTQHRTAKEDRPSETDLLE
jgi:hypothetical protein